MLQPCLKYQQRQHAQPDIMLQSCPKNQQVHEKAEVGPETPSRAGPVCAPSEVGCANAVVRPQCWLTRGFPQGLPARVRAKAARLSGARQSGQRRRRHQHPAAAALAQTCL